MMMVEIRIARVEMYFKHEVKYEHPAKGEEHCGICRHYREPRRCEIVRGTIEPEDWCNKFKGK